MTWLELTRCSMAGARARCTCARGSPSHRLRAPAVWPWSRAQGFGQSRRSRTQAQPSSPVSGRPSMRPRRKRLRRGAGSDRGGLDLRRDLPLCGWRADRGYGRRGIPPGSVHLPHWVENNVKQFVPSSCHGAQTRPPGWNGRSSRGEGRWTAGLCPRAAWIAGATAGPTKWRDLEDQLGAAPRHRSAGQINRPGPAGKRRSDWLGRRGGWF